MRRSRPTAARSGAATKTTGLKARIALGDVRHTTGAVNLRTAAGVSHHRLSVLKPGARLIVVGKGQDGAGRWWLKVQTGSRTGWVARWLTAA